MAGTLVMLEVDIEKWKDITKFFKENYSELTIEEQSAFDVLSDFWRNGNFNKAECLELIQILSSEAMKHANNNLLKTKSQAFREICKRYYTKDEQTFKEFQKKMGGRPSRNISIPTPVRDVRPVTPPPVSPARSESYRRIDYNGGDYYIGESKNGLRHGHGKYFYSNGSWDEGSWENDALHGHARRYINSSARLDEGQYANNNRVGRGRMTWDSGDWSEGEWSNDGLHGQGVSFVKEYSRTDRGQFRNGVRFGRGQMVWGDGHKYDGEWNEDGAHGHGTFYYPNWSGGAKYTGQFVKHKRHGKGKVVWNNGDWYDGSWLDGEKTGQGMQYVAKYKRTDIGQFRNGSRVGSGEMKWADGSRYVGTWNDVSGKLQGQGTYYNPDGSTEKGKWVDGNWVKSKSTWKDIGGCLNVIALFMWIGGAIFTWVSNGFFAALISAFVGMIVYGIFVWILEKIGLLD